MLGEASTSGRGFEPNVLHRAGEPAAGPVAEGEIKTLGCQVEAFIVGLRDEATVEEKT